MTDTVLFDERGVRVPKTTYFPSSSGTELGWQDRPNPFDATVLGWGFVPVRNWRPSYYAARMGKGWRVFELDMGEFKFVVVRVVSGWWKSADPTQRRFPNIASVEVYLRTICAHG